MKNLSTFVPTLSTNANMGVDFTLPANASVTLVFGLEAYKLTDSDIIMLSDECTRQIEKLKSLTVQGERVSSQIEMWEVRKGRVSKLYNNTERVAYQEAAKGATSSTIPTSSNNTLNWGDKDAKIMEVQTLMYGCNVDLLEDDFLLSLASQCDKETKALSELSVKGVRIDKQVADLTERKETISKVYNAK